MSLVDVLEIGFEVGIKVLEGAETIAEGMQEIFEETGGKGLGKDE